MSKKIEVGTMVWCKNTGCDWNSEQREFIGMASDGSYVCWIGGAYTPTMWNQITAEDPHQPRVPDWMPENCVLWEYENGRFQHVNGSKGMGLDVLYYENLGRLEGFAHMIDGVVKVWNSPILWHHGTCPCVVSVLEDGTKIPRTKLLGAVMRKK